MSVSPPVYRLSSSSASRQEELINAYEAEEERIINLLSRKLEKVSKVFFVCFARCAKTFHLFFLATRGKD